MIRLIRTASTNVDFSNLVSELDADLKIRDGDDHDFFKQFNKSDTIGHVVIAYIGEQAAGCGALREVDTATMEIKRMFTTPMLRGRGVAMAVLKELEAWAESLGYRRCILETGEKQPEAISLYRKMGYRVIPNYGPYKDVASSVCFEKAW